MELSKQLEALGVNPLLFGIEVGELTDTTPEQLQAYQDELHDTQSAIRAVMGR